MGRLNANYHKYNEAWSHLKAARRSGNYAGVADAADQVAYEAREIIKKIAANKEALVENCSHPRTDTNGTCEVCGKNMFEGVW